MRATTATDFRKNLAYELDRVESDREALIIVRSGGKPAAVLLSLEEFSSWNETNYLLRSPANARALMEAIRELDAGDRTERKLVE